MYILELLFLKTKAANLNRHVVSFNKTVGKNNLQVELNKLRPMRTLINESYKIDNSRTIQLEKIKQILLHLRELRHF